MENITVINQVSTAFTKRKLMQYTVFIQILGHIKSKPHFTEIFNKVTCTTAYNCWMSCK